MISHWTTLEEYHRVMRWICPGCGVSFNKVCRIHVLKTNDLYMTVACQDCWEGADLSKKLRYTRRTITRNGMKSEWPTWSAAVWAEAGGQPGLVE